MVDAQATPSREQEQRAKWDFLLRELELRSEEMGQKRGVDYDMKLEQLRQLKTYEPRNGS